MSEGSRSLGTTLGPAAALTLSDVRFNLRLDVNAQVPFRLSAPRAATDSLCGGAVTGRAEMVVGTRLRGCLHAIDR